MNILFEIADRDLMIIAAVFLAICFVLALVFRAIINKNKVLPISEDERFDNEDDDTVKEEKKELTEEQIKAKEELERVYAQMSMDLERQEEVEEADDKDNIDEFEKEQEENAIISYQELMAQAEKLKKQADQYEANAEDYADMKVHEAMNTYKEHTEKAEKVEPKKEEYHGFKNSEIISPIFGIQKEKKKSAPKHRSNGIINGAYEEKSQAESEQNMDFLNSLKEFRRNL